MKKVIFVANVGFTVTNFRSELMQNFRDLGYQVRIVCPVNYDFNTKLEKYQEEIIPLFLSRRGVNPINDLKTFFQLIRIYNKEKPDIILNYTIKPTIYSSIAAKVSGVSQIHSTMTGLGYVFTGKSFKKFFILGIIKLQLKLALSFNKKVFFQNPDDLALIVNLGLISKDKTKIVNGSGVNLDFFKTDPDVLKRPSSFLFIGRVLKDKGVGEFVEAAKRLKNKYPQAIFGVLGDTDENPASFTKEDIQIWKKEGVIEYFAPTEDVRPYLASFQVFVLPSYREGTPRSVLEAMAMGLPIITTDAPGCRETVRDNVNGFLVRVQSVEDLVDRMEQFLQNPDLVSQMGRESLILAKNKYDVKLVNQSIMSEMVLI